MESGSDSEVITLGGGCFWCLQPIFEELRGVEKVVVGYAGGGKEHPTYEEVCTGKTGHAEVIEVTYNPEAIALDDILRVFFTVHDPTTPNRQGADIGTQYRSVVLCHSPEQMAVTGRIIGEFEAEGVWRRPIVTEVRLLEAFFRAEEYHQDYFEKNPTAGYCRIVIAPKVAKFRKEFIGRLKA